MHKRLAGAMTAFLTLVILTVVPPQPVLADYPLIKTVSTITGTTNNVQVQGMNGQSSCTIEINGTASGTAVGYENGLQVQVSAVQLPDNGTASPSPSISGPGTFTANCAGLQAFAFHPTSVTGSATITVIASGAIGRVIGMKGGSGSATSVQAGSNIVIATPSPGVFVVSVTSAPHFSGAVSLGTTGSSASAQGSYLELPNTANHTFITNDDDSPYIIQGVSSTFLNLNNGTNGGFLAMDQSGNLGILGSIASGTLTAGRCVQATTNGTLASTAAACSAGTVTSVSGTGNIQSTGGTTPVISVTAAPSFSNITLGTAGTTRSGYFILPNDDGISTQQTLIWTSSLNSIVGITGACLADNVQGGIVLMTQDCSGNLAVAGAFYSTTGTIQTSLRKMKNNISDISDVGMDIIRKTKIVKFCYKVEHCKKGEVRHVGFIADDTDALLSTKKHNGEDLGGTAALALYGAQENDAQISELRKQLDDLTIISGFLLMGLILALLGVMGRK